MNTIESSTTKGNQVEIDLSHIPYALWKDKTRIALYCLVFLALGIAYSVFTKNEYVSGSLLIPSPQADGTGLAAFAGNLGGLAELAGLNLNNNQELTTKAIATIKSRKFIGNFINEFDVKPQIFPELRRDDLDAWRDPTLSERAIYWLKSLIGLEDKPLVVEPSDEDSHERFLDHHLKISQDKKSNLVTLRVMAYDPKLAKAWNEEIVNKINNHLRQEELDEAVKSIELLEDQLENTNIAAMQQSIYELIEMHNKKAVLAQVRDEYAFQIIDPPAIPEKKSWPFRSLICLISLLFGFFVGSAIAIAKHYRNLLDHSNGD